MLDKKFVLGCGATEFVVIHVEVSMQLGRMLANTVGEVLSGNFRNVLYWVYFKGL